MLRFAHLGWLAGLALFSATSTLAQQSEPNAAIVQLWLQSGHADAESPSFTHWNEEGEIPANCATCHSGQGFRAFYGMDGSAAGEISHPIPTGGVIDCATCHEDGARDIANIRFPSGVELAPPPGTATCLTCHQGRESGADVAAATADMPEDEVNPDLAFINPHYAVAAATLFGAEVKGGYEYPGRDYAGRFEHVPPFSTCTDCHDPHSTAVRVETCTGCHQDAELRAIRTSKDDFDNDGDTQSGIYTEIATLHETLLTTIEAYAADVAGTPIAYADRFPYFFRAGEEMTPANRYNAWTPALLRAAYNYQFVAKDEGAYAHNPHYAIQLLHDSVQSLASGSGIEVSLGARPGI